MRTRSRLIVQDAITARESRELPFEIVFCDPNRANYKGTSGKSYQYQPLVWTDESITDDPSRSRNPKSVFHRKADYAILRGTGNCVNPNYSGNGEGDFGTVSYGGDSADMGTEQHVTIALSKLTGWDTSGWPNYGAPNGWGINVGYDPSEESLISDCYEKMRGIIADHLLNLMESEQMISSVRNLCQLLPKVRKGWKRPSFWRKQSADLFLSWKYGFKPFFSDMQKTWSEVHKIQTDIQRMRQNGIILRASASVKRPATFAYTRVYNIRANGVSVYRDDAVGRVVRDPEIRYVLRAKPRYEFNTDTFRFLNSLFTRFTSGPANFAWERVPFSFVLDWFVDLRGLMQSIDECMGLVPYVDATMTRSATYRVETTQSWHKGSPCGGSLRDGPSAIATYSHYERSLVSPQANWFVWRNRFGKSQAASTAALISQRLK